MILATALGTVMTIIVIPAVAAGLSAIITLAVTRASDAASKRREGYAQAVSTLVAWVELPYRIRRRVDDQPATLACLANIGHDLQERLATHEAWIAGEHPELASAYRDVRTALGRPIGEAAAEAWNTAPVATAAGMNIGLWGPAAGAKQHIATFQAAVENRFGWQRVKAATRTLAASTTTNASA